MTLRASLPISAETPRLCSGLSPLTWALPVSQCDTFESRYLSSLPELQKVIAAAISEWLLISLGGHVSCCLFDIGLLC